MTILYPQRFFHRVVGNAYAADRKRKRIRDASIYTSKKYRSSFYPCAIFFVSICPVAIPGTYLMVFLVVALLLC